MTSFASLSLPSLDPLGDGISAVTLIQHVGDDKMIVNAARVSFGGDSNLPLNQRDEKLIAYLLKHQHGSPFEHNLITFKIVCPVFVDRQLVRHRVGVSKNEISARYTEVQERAYTPATFRQQAKSNRQASVEADSTLDQAAALQAWADASEQAFATYHKLLALGVTREQARGVLPLALYTESYWTFNLRSLMHFWDLRLHAGAQWETVQFAAALLELTGPLFPVSVAAWKALKETE